MKNTSFNTIKYTVLFLFSISGFSQVSTFSLAERLYNSQQYDSSAIICTREIDKLLVNDTLYNKFLFLRSNCYVKQANFKLAISDYKLLIKNDPKNIPYYVGMSYLYGEKRDYKNCFSVLKKALSIDSNNIYVLNNFSYYSNQNKEYQKGLKYANIAISLNPDSVWMGIILNNRGYSYLGLKMYKDALTEVNHSLLFFPTNPYAYLYRAEIQVGLKNVDAACIDLNKAKNLGEFRQAERLLKKYCK